MSFSMRDLLVVDHDHASRQMFAGMIMSQCGFFNVLTAGSLQGALQVLSARPVDMVITGLSLAEIAALHLIEKLRELYPEKRVIHMTMPKWKLVRTNVTDHPGLVHFDQSQNLSLLINRMCTEMGIDYGGQLRGIRLSSFLQLLELDGSSCTLKIVAKGKIGFVVIADGKLVNAIDAEGGYDPKSAALRILSWEDVTISIDYSKRNLRRAIQEPIMMLLLESGRLDDEQQSQKGELRLNTRHTISTAFDYHIGNGMYQCYVRDISLGGAYIETDQDLTVGHTITLVMAEPESQCTHAIDGIVVRMDRKGVGIRFSEMTLGQKEMIQALINSGTGKATPSESLLTEPVPSISEGSNFLKSLS